MDFESPDVQKEFPGLYASEAGRRSNESDFSDGDHEKPSKKDLLIGRRKDKKDSKKDRGYAALAGESSPDEELDTKSPSKSKKTKSFKFPTKSKEKREKSRDKEKVNEREVKEKDHGEKDKKKEKEKKEKEKKEKLKEKDKEKEEKLKVKEAKDKVKEVKEKVKEVKEKVKEVKETKVKEKEKDKLKEKDKDKKEKKANKIPANVTTGVPFEEIFTIGVALPIFGVPLHVSIERSRCHDDTSLPLLVRNAIDYIQEFGVNSENVYRVDVDKIRLQQLERLYTEREPIFPYHWDISTACGLLKKYLSELPEPLLTHRFTTKFEEIILQQNESQTDLKLSSLIDQLPSYNRTLIGWLISHFACVVSNEKENHLNLQTMASVMAGPLKMSINLLVGLIKNSKMLFPDVDLTKYVPPLPTLGPNLPETAFEITAELRKQESLLNQIHAEMHAGFVTQKREEQLWEGQRIVTQLKRKLRSIRKSNEPHTTLTQSSVEERQNTIDEDNSSERSKSATDIPSKLPSDDDVKKHITRVITTVEINNDAFKVEMQTVDVSSDKTSQIDTTDSKSGLTSFEDNFDASEVNFEESKAKPDTTSENSDQGENKAEKPKLSKQELASMRLQLEHAEFLHLKSILQAKINAEKFEIVKLRTQTALKNKQESCNHNGGPKDVQILQSYTEAEKKEAQRLTNDNALLENKRLNLITQIFQTRLESMQLRIQLAMNEIL